MAEKSEFFELSFDTLLCSSYHAQSFGDPAIDMPLPAHVDPRKLAHASTELSGDIPVSCLSRLASATVRINDSAKAIVAFQIDESGFTLIEGSVSSLIPRRSLFTKTPAIVLRSSAKPVSFSTIEAIINAS